MLSPGISCPPSAGDDDRAVVLREVNKALAALSEAFGAIVDLKVLVRQASAVRFDMNRTSDGEQRP